MIETQNTVNGKREVCVAGVAHRACSCSHAASILSSVKTLYLVVAGVLALDIVFGDSRRTPGFRSHDYRSENGRLIRK